MKISAKTQKACKQDIYERVDNIKSLIGIDMCPLVSGLRKNASIEEFIDAWNTDCRIIMGQINDIELLCGSINIDEVNMIYEEGF